MVLLVQFWMLTSSTSKTSNCFELKNVEGPTCLETKFTNQNLVNSIWQQFILDECQRLLINAALKISSETDRKAAQDRKCQVTEKLTGGPSSGGMIILLEPPGLMSLIPSSNPANSILCFSEFLLLNGIRYREDTILKHRLLFCTWNQCVSAHSNSCRSTLQVRAVDSTARLVIANVIEGHLEKRT